LSTVANAGHRTGYHSAREDLKPIFGEDVISKVSKLQVDEEDEVNLYRPSGQAGVGQNRCLMFHLSVVLIDPYSYGSREVTLRWVVCCQSNW
jgi:hypothetical protein